MNFLKSRVAQLSIAAGSLGALVVGFAAHAAADSEIVGVATTSGATIHDNGMAVLPVLFAAVVPVILVLWVFRKALSLVGARR